MIEHRFESVVLQWPKISQILQLLTPPVTVRVMTQTVKLQSS